MVCVVMNKEEKQKIRNARELIAFAETIDLETITIQKDIVLKEHLNPLIDELCSKIRRRTMSRDYTIVMVRH